MYIIKTQLIITMSNFPSKISVLITLFLIFISIHFPLSKTQSDSVSFVFSNFTHNAIGFIGDAISSGNAIQLTGRDSNGKPLQNSVGQAVYLPPVHIWDCVTGELADFKTVFYFTINRSGSVFHGDGFAFFMAPLDYGIPNNSTGGLLGLVSPETAFNCSMNQVLAVEFDSFENEWDPNPLSGFPHVGIDVNSVESVVTVGWNSHVEPDGALGRALVRYDSVEKELFVLVSYPGSAVSTVDDDISLVYTVDLRKVLPEWVRIGFSGATGDLVEKHDILFWSFSSSFNSSNKEEELYSTL